MSAVYSSGCYISDYDFILLLYFKRRLNVDRNMGTDSDDTNLEKKQRVPMDRRSGLERRSGIERRMQNLGPPGGKERRCGIDRRSGLDRRSGIDRRLDTYDQSANPGQGRYENSAAMESGGLSSWLGSLFKRWFS